MEKPSRIMSGLDAPGRSQPW